MRSTARESLSKHPCLGIATRIDGIAAAVAHSSAHPPTLYESSASFRSVEREYFWIGSKGMDSV